MPLYYTLLVDRYTNLIYSMLLARIGPDEEAQDLAQEAFLKAYGQLNQLAEPEKLDLTFICLALCFNAILWTLFDFGGLYK